VQFSSEEEEEIRPVQTKINICESEEEDEEISKEVEEKPEVNEDVEMKD
jgi:hypothetical protein